MSLSYDQNLIIQHSECDPWDRMSPGAALRRVQAISTDQCESLGMDEALYSRTHTAFLLSKMSLEMYAMPSPGTAVRLQTVAYGVKRAVYYRLTTMYDEAGKKLFQTDTRWVLANTETRHILRTAPPEIGNVYTGEPEQEAHHIKLKKPAEGLEPLAQLTATYSLCDRNGHINNTRYADLMCDFLPPATLAGGPPQKVLLCYHSEIKLNEAFTLNRAQVGENCYYFSAEKDGKRRFEGSICF